MPKVKIGGGWVTDRTTARALHEAERLYGAKVVVSQGSYHNGSASAGTHLGGGVLDISVRGLSRSNINRLVRCLRTVGLWAWYRDGSSGFSPHIHCVRVGCKDLNPIARNQVVAARAGYNGLGHLGRAAKDRHRGMKISVHSYRYYKRRIKGQ